MFNKSFKLLNIDLRMFDGEAGGGSAAGGQAGGGSQGAEAGNSTVGGQQSKTSSEKPVVVYGKQSTTETENPAPGAQEQKPGENKTPTPEERQSAFLKFKTDYKDLYDAEVQGIIKSRLGKYKGLETQYAQAASVVDFLHEVYGTSDITQLMSKLQGETIKELAEKAGMTVEQYKGVMALRQENKRLQSEKQTVEAEKETNAKVGKWWEEANKLIGTKDTPGLYPDFNFKEWAQDDKFLNVLESLTRSGFPNPVQQAYEVCNLENIKKGAAQKAEENTTKNIQARGNRPPENGTKSSPGMIIKNDVSKLSREDRKEIARRAARGENISF